MPRTARIEELLRVLPERRWTPEEQAEVEAIVGDDERKQFEIEGSYSHEDPAAKPKAYDRKPDKSGLDDGVPIPRNARTLPHDASPLPTSHPNQDILVRIGQLEAVTKDLFAKLAALEKRIRE